MKNTFRKFGLFMAMACAMFSTAVFAQQAPVDTSQFFEVAGGAGRNKSVYSTVIAELAAVCKAGDIELRERTTNGGPDNVDLIKNNKVELAVVPGDLLEWFKIQNPASVASIKTIVPLHPEAEHLIARSDVKKEGGVMGIGADKIVFNTPESLKGRQVGAAGGSVFTATILNQLLGYGWVVKSYPDNDALIKDLSSGAIDAGVISAGIGSPSVASIKGQFKLLPIRGNDKTAAVYSPTKIDYPNLGGGQAVDTLTAPALLVSRTFSSKKMLARLAALRQCFNDNVDEIKDKKNTHPAWQGMTANATSKWPMYDLSSVAAPAAAPVAPAPTPTPAPRKK